MSASEIPTTGRPGRDSKIPGRGPRKLGTSPRRVILALVAATLLAGLLASVALATPPTVSTDPADDISSSGATVHATVNPNGTEVSPCQFDYGTTTSYGQHVACQPTVVNGSNPVSVRANLSGLSPLTTYHYAVDASNVNGDEVVGPDQTFTTPAAPAPGAPQVITGSASNVTVDGATFNGQVNPNGNQVTDCRFEYGITTGYGGNIPCVESIGSGTGPVSVHADVSGLSPKTSYHYRLVATNDQGTVNGSDRYTACPCYFDFASTGASLSTLQAGAHPDVVTSFTLNGDAEQNDGTGQPFPWARLSTFSAELPPGMLADPQAFPRCSKATFAHALDIFFGNPNAPQCPVDSQVGFVSPGGYNFLGPPGNNETPLFLLEDPAGGAVAQFGFFVGFVPVVLQATVDPARDYAVTVSTEPAPTSVPITGSITTVWGNPPNPSNDPHRGSALSALLCGGFQCGPTPSGMGPTAFNTNPTSCGPASITFKSDTYEGVAATPTVVPLGDITGCASVPFHPAVNIAPTSSQADSSSGIDASITLDESGMVNPNALASAHLKKAVVTLPQGFALNPSAADGLQGCTEAQIGMVSTSPIRFNDADPTCPDGSNVGTVKITTPPLAQPLQGSLYLADQHDNPFGQPPTLAGYLVAKGPGVIIKAAGRFDLDPQTGQITATFDNNPQQPFSDLELHFKSGPHGVLVTPSKCGTYQIGSELTPWSGTPPVDLTTDFTIDQGCEPGGFAPALNAGVTNPVAGSSSSFALQLTRQDGEQNIASLDTTLPPGLVAKLAGVPLCPDAQAAIGDCPAGSQVGQTTVGTGVGPDLLYIPQPGKSPTEVYLAGPYKGAPYSLVIKVPAQAGPFDLGTVAVRAGIYIDPTTAQVTVKSDPLPQIIKGIPLPYRDIRVMIDRPGFMRAPTSCNPMQISAEVTGTPLGGPVSLNSAELGFASTTGTVAHLTSRFQVGSCAELPFSPKLQFKLTGKGQTHSGQHPTLTATLTQGAGQANIHSAKVALPLALALDPNNSQNVCNYDTAQAVHGGAVGCPASTIVGTGTAVTPLLDKPLTGNVYLVQGIRFGANGQRIRTLPTLLIPLRGQIALDLRASSAVNGDQQLVTTFSTIPDAPVSKFTLQINGGPKGLLVITGRGKTICGKAQIANGQFGAQSGKQEFPNPRFSTPACKGVTHHRRHRHK